MCADDDGASLSRTLYFNKSRCRPWILSAQRCVDQNGSVSAVERYMLALANDLSFSTVVEEKSNKRVLEEEVV